MCEKKTREERLMFVGGFFGMTGELPSTSLYLRWCVRNNTLLSKVSAIRDIKQVAKELGVTIKEEPKQFKSKLSSAVVEKNIPSREVVVEKVVKKSYTDKDVEVLTKEIFARNDKKMGLTWKNNISNIGKVRREVIEMLEKGVFHLT
jgi:hypothetical protein